MNNVYEINFKETGSEEIGYLVPLEQNREIPFEIKRVYYTYGVPESVKRGFHGHRELEQVFICLNGEIKIKCFDGKNEEEYLLNEANKGLFVGRMIWHEVYDYSHNSVLMALASDYYDENDYIRDRDIFIKTVKSGR